MGDHNRRIELVHAGGQHEIWPRASAAVISPVRVLGLATKKRPIGSEDPGPGSVPDQEVPEALVCTAGTAPWYLLELFM